MQFVTKKSTPRNSKRFNPHLYWTILLATFILAIAIELVYFSLFFLNTASRLDAPATPTLETNAAKIKSMNKRLDVVEKAIQMRVGE